MRKYSILNLLFMRRRYNEIYEKFVRNILDHRNECEAHIDPHNTYEIDIKWRSRKYTFSIDDFSDFLCYCRCYVLEYDKYKDCDKYKECGVIHYVRASRRTSYDFYVAFVKPELDRVEELKQMEEAKKIQFVIDGANYD